MLQSDGGGAGYSLGNAIARAVRPNTAGNSVGNAVSRTIRPKGGGRRSIQPVRGGRGGGRRSIPENRGGGGGGKDRSIPEKPTRPMMPSIDSYLGTDAAYQNVVRGNNRSLKDFLSEMTRRRGESNTSFKQTTANMERDRVQQLDDLRDEFASRGLIQSGLYGEEQGKFQTEFTNQLNALKQQQTALLADLLSQETNFKREQQLALERARQEALARRAAKYNVGA